jgi:ParB family chromosome partitioning protein
MSTSTTIPGELLHVDPATLTIETNVRTDATLTREFIASIKEHGVLVPVLVKRHQDGTLCVRTGQRRTLAAVEAGLPTIPAYVLDSDETITDNAASITRIIEQVTENDQRAAIFDSHRVAAYQQLSLLGLSAGQIAKRTSAKKATVDKVLTVAASTVAQEAQAQHNLTLDQALVLSEFDDDPQAVEALTKEATKNPGQFAHLAQQLRDKREEERAIAQIEADLIAAQVRIVPEPRYGDGGNLLRLTELKATPDSSGGTDFEPADHATCPGHGAYINTSWRGVQAVYVCTDWKANGHATRWSYSTSTTKTGPLTDEQKAERKTVLDNNKSWRSAEVVRREWLATFAGRKSAPTDAAAYIAQFMVSDTDLLRRAGERNHRLATTWITGVSPDDLPTSKPPALADSIAAATPGRAVHIALMLALAASEQNTSVDTWRRPQPSVRRYLTALEGWGYTLSDVEKIARGRAKR